MDGTQNLKSPVDIIAETQGPVVDTFLQLAPRDPYQLPTGKLFTLAHCELISPFFILESSYG